MNSSRVKCFCATLAATIVISSLLGNLLVIIMGDREGRSNFDRKKDKYHQLHILSYEAVFCYVFDNGFLQTSLSALTMYLNS
ncbi:MULTISPECIES: hypothetical protein [unclassified Microcoleus]|uniref:hypothetical protein n=2 Tax=unclassified Microcoleus TaxID=2642155 RepID=UPI0025FE5608|nr:MULTISPECIES: hypothetical protein [unclassified Microcoleus]